MVGDDRRAAPPVRLRSAWRALSTHQVEPGVLRRKIVISTNSAWNIFNFRLGLIRALQAAGYDVIALAPDDGYGEALRRLGIPYRHIDMDRKGTSVVQDILLLFRYRATLKEIGAELFVGYTAKPNVYGSLAAQSLNMRVINNVAGLGTAFIGGGPLKRILSTLYRIAFQRSATIFFQNQDDQTAFADAGLVRRQQSQLLPGSGVDLDRFVSTAPSRARADLSFLFVGRLLWDKGVREFIYAARKLRVEAPNTRFRMLGVVDAGNRTAVPAAELAMWVREGLIDYLGSAEDVRPHIDDSDCIVLPSYREGLSRALLEGAAMGKPLIASDVPGCREVVMDGVNGFLCNARDSDSLADAMRRLRRLTLEERIRMGVEGRQLVVRKFDEAIVIDRYKAAIWAALNG